MNAHTDIRKEHLPLLVLRPLLGGYGIFCGILLVPDAPS